MTDRKQQLEQLQSLTNAIGAVLQEPGSDLKKLDGIAGLLEGTHTDEGMLALIMISVFKAGKAVGANELKQRIASLQI